MGAPATIWGATPPSLFFTEENQTPSTEAARPFSNDRAKTREEQTSTTQTHPAGTQQQACRTELQSYAEVHLPASARPAVDVGPLGQ